MYKNLILEQLVKIHYAIAMKKIVKIIITIFYLSIFIFLVFNFEGKKAPSNKEKGAIQGENVNITARIKLQQIDFKVYPEKRVPKENNWSTFVYFKAKDLNSEQIHYSGTDITNDQGEGKLILKPSENIPNGSQIVTIKGISHLSKRYRINFTKQFEMFDFTIFGELLAGDTHKSQDNFINSLDISTLISNLETSDYISDLNRDSKVNSLDLSTQLYNLGKAGET